MRNAKAYNSRVKAEAVRMPVLGGVKRKRDAEDLGDKLREASKATNAMLKVAGELLLEEGTEDACHAITIALAAVSFSRPYISSEVYTTRKIPTMSLSTAQSTSRCSKILTCGLPK